jgi:general L-amino acid transport system permease protein
MGGFMLNLILGTVCVSLSIPLGIVLALGRQSNMPIIKGICVVFIEFIRGVPLITLLFVANVVLSYFFPPGTNLDLILRVIIMITLFSAAYIAEVIRGGLAALPRGQYEAADSLGLDYPAGNAFNHPAAGAQDFYSRHRKRGGWSVQRYDFGLSYLHV